MGIFDAHLTIKEKADKGLPLPDTLNTRNIAVLFSDDSRKQDLISQAMAEAIASRKLKIQASRNYSSAYINECGRVFVVWIYEQDEAKGNYAGPVEIHKGVFLDWLKSEGEPLPVDNLLLNWVAGLQAEAVGDTGAVDDVAPGQATIKAAGKNQKRTKILNDWYQALCTELENNSEAIIQRIDSLTIESIKEGLERITPTDDKYLWVSGADRWIMDNGESVWKFKRTQGGKSKK